MKFILFYTRGKYAPILLDNYRLKQLNICCLNLEKPIWKTYCTYMIQLSAWKYEQTGILYINPELHHAVFAWARNNSVFRIR